MDKRTKKRLEVLRKKLQLAEQQLAGARRQTDEPGEVQRLEVTVSQLQQEIQELKTK